jgi:phosphoglycerate dehydrogenase-like enzyme
VKILVADNLYARYVPDLKQAVGGDATWVVLSPTDARAVSREIEDSGVFVGSKLSAELIHSAKALKLVICCAAGTNGIAIEALPDHVPVTNTYHHEQSIAEYVLMAMVALSRGLLQADRALREGSWKSVFFDSTRAPHRILAGQTVGIVGLGRTGSEVARLARALGMRVIAVKRNPAETAPDIVDECRGTDELPWLLSHARFVAICAPLTKETRGRIGKDEFRLMKSDAFLINVGRGEIVDEEALYTALSERTIAGAAIDVWYRYPKEVGDRSEPSTLPFKNLDNIIMTPHHSGQAEENFRARADDIGYNVKAFMEGRALRNLVPR